MILKRCEKRVNKRAQVTIFIIIGILIIAGIVSYLYFSSFAFKQSAIPASLSPFYDAYLNCLNENLDAGISVLESQGGYIELPEFEPGSNYAPFSSQLDFAGTPVQYWYYISGNGIENEKVPTTSVMEEQLSDFMKLRVKKCNNLKDYFEQGFQLVYSEDVGDISVKINQDNVEFNLEMPITIKKSDESVVIGEHKVIVISELGKLYGDAVKIYQKEQKELFLERYAVDNMRLYAPVDGMEFTCSPKTWIAQKVFSELSDAIEFNTLSLRGNKNDYTLVDSDNKYFVINLGVESDVRFINSKEWPYSFEVNPSEGDILMAMPVGNQAGLGILGFCYVPYHFVYDVKYPVLVQVSSKNSDEIFQFPIAVIIDNNNPRKPVDGSAISSDLPRICENNNTLVNVRVKDSSGNLISADVYYKCLGVECMIGKTENGILEGSFPQCVNGFVSAKAEGYRNGKILFSTNIPGSAELVLTKSYKKTIDLKSGGSSYNGRAIINFISEEGSIAVVYPEQKEIELSEGDYFIQVYIYEGSSIKLQAVKKQQCIDAPQTGIGGIFGLTKEKCFDIEYPEQIVSDALSGGGSSDRRILESELRTSSSIEINAPAFKKPTTVEELQNNYLKFEDSELSVILK